MLVHVLLKNLAACDYQKYIMPSEYLAKFAKALREFLSLICIIAVYLEIWELIRKPLH